MTRDHRTYIRVDIAIQPGIRKKSAKLHASTLFVHAGMSFHEKSRDTVKDNLLRLMSALTWLRYTGSEWEVEI